MISAKCNRIKFRCVMKCDYILITRRIFFLVIFLSISICLGIFFARSHFFSQKQNTFVHIQHIYLINIQNWLKRFNIILNKSKAIPFNFSIRLICFILIVWCQNSNIVYGKRASVLFFLFFKKGLKGLRLKIFVAFFRFFVLLEYFRCWWL